MSERAGVSEAAEPAPTPAERFQDTARILEALRLAVRDALLEHKRAGNPVAVWRDDRVVWVPAEEIPVAPEEE